jgi:predicted RecA/RadA family phage recombinase
MLYEKKPVSDHIEVQAFPTAKEKGDVVVFGNLLGFSDYKTASGAPGSVDIGKSAAIFQAATADLTGAAAVATDVYLDGAGALTTTVGSNTFFGTIVAVEGDTFDIARV